MGLLLGGILTEYVNWRWCLLVNVPVAVLAIAAAVTVVKESKAEGDTRYDLPGALLVALGLASLVYGFTRAEHGWASAQTIGFIVAGLILVGIFGVVESRSVSGVLGKARLVTIRSHTRPVCDR